MNTLIYSTHSASYASLAYTVAINRLDYCPRHSYSSLSKCFFKPTLGEHTLEALLTLKQLLECGIWDRIVSMGVDVVITNLDRTVEDVVHVDSNVALVRETIGPKGINNEIVVWRRTDKALALLYQAIEAYDYWKDKPCQWQDWLTDNDKLLVDSGALQVLPSRAMNSTHNVHPESDWQPGDWIVHFYRHTLPDKERLAKAYVSGDIESVRGIVSDARKFLPS